MRRSRLLSRCVSVAVLASSLICSPTFAADDSSKTGGDQEDSGEGAGKKASSDSASKGGSTPAVTVGSNTGVIESYVLADLGLRSCASKIATAVKKSTTIKTLVLFDQAQRDMLSALTSFQINAEITGASLTKALKSYDALSDTPLPADLAQPAAVGTGISVVAPIVDTLISSITNIIGLFRTDVTIGGTVLAVDDEIIIDEVSRAEIKDSRTVLRPSSYFAEVFDPDAVKNSPVVTQLTGLYDQRNRAQTRILELQPTVTSLTAQLKAAKTDKARAHITEYLVPRSVCSRTCKRLRRCSMRSWRMSSPRLSPRQVPSPPPPADPAASAPPHGTDHAADTPPPEKDKKNAPADTTKIAAASPPPSLATLVTAELWLKKFKQPNVALLTLHTHVAGGGYETKSNLWTFFGGARISYSGGSVSSFSVLAASDGHVLTSGSCPAYTGFVRGSDVTTQRRRRCLSDTTSAESVHAKFSAGSLPPRGFRGRSVRIRKSSCQAGAAANSGVVPFKRCIRRRQITFNAETGIPSQITGLEESTQPTAGAKTPFEAVDTFLHQAPFKSCSPPRSIPKRNRTWSPSKAMWIRRIIPRPSSLIASEFKACRSLAPRPSSWSPPKEAGAAVSTGFFALQSVDQTVTTLPQVEAAGSQKAATDRYRALLKEDPALATSERALFPGSPEPRTPKLIMFDPTVLGETKEKGLRPTWLVKVGGMVFFIDARNGTVLHEYRNVHSLTSFQIDDFNSRVAPAHPVLSEGGSASARDPPRGDLGAAELHGCADILRLLESRCPRPVHL